MILNIIGQIMGFMGSLCLLLFGMNLLSNGIQKGAGKNLQKLLSKITGNRFTALLTGIGVTAIIQSSGATTVMVVSFVNAEILTLKQAIAVIFGANIGTTVTAWIVAIFGFNFSIATLAIPLFGVGYILKYFKHLKIHNFADSFMGFALLFMGLGLLKEVLSLSPSSTAFLLKISSLGRLGILIGVFFGALITALLHSSSAMTAIVLTMAANGSLSWEMSAALILGSNIGSTIDAVMSSFGASVNSKRTALVHVGFNVTGTLIVLCIFKPFLSFIDFIVPGTPASNITTHISMLHTIFNVCATLIFLPFIDQIAALSSKLIKDTSKEKNIHYTFPAILPSSHISADIYSFQIQKEISKMAAKVMEMFDFICDTVLNAGISIEENLQKDVSLDSLENSVEEVDNIENYIDEMNEAITQFLQDCTRLPNANHEDRVHFYHLLAITDSLENLSDECSSIMFTLKKYLVNDNFEMQKESTKKIESYLDLVRNFFEQVCLYLTIGMTSEEKQQSELLEQKIDSTKRELKLSSRNRLEHGGDVKTELAFIDLVRKIEKAGDCVYSCAKAI
ncbi:Na/Pi cotransporter family protein [Treponema pectinovorum]|uniref:Na/Pi cotransporter family protein n=1 Tax=Treponema pectinovorum TaxID=164 RepID=UPI0011CBF416|nr:Na/Pi cotransporter family protein [Treponema pectinovorum]